MKCPKCDYLGFETGDRCKNCGYDFSLLADAEPAAAAAVPVLAFDADLTLRSQPVVTPGTDAWLQHLDTTLTSAESTSPLDARGDDIFDISLTPATIESPVPDAFVGDPGSDSRAIDDVEVSRAAAPAEAEEREEPEPLPAPVVTATVPAPALPLFTPIDDDTPLITLPPAPRPPLSVRRTPDLPRLRAVPKPLPRPGPAVEPVLAFVDETEADAEADVTTEPEPLPVRTRAGAAASSRIWRAAPASGRPAPGRRLAAAALDHLILFSIDLIVVYFTLRMVSLDLGAWQRLPPVPLGAFLLLIKLSYFSAFTAVGGQTVGKMAARLRVVTDDQGGELEGAQAVRRTIVGALSTVAFGLGFLPGLVGDGRALHDRAAHTRVVELESA
ncbi:MAG: RDD family protein [Vicinamibacterales bacterium]